MSKLITSWEEAYAERRAAALGRYHARREEEHQRRGLSGLRMALAAHDAREQLGAMRWADDGGRA